MRLIEVGEGIKNTQLLNASLLQTCTSSHSGAFVQDFLVLFQYVHFESCHASKEMLHKLKGLIFPYFHRCFFHLRIQ